MNSVITMEIFTDICVFHFSILVSVDHQKCSLVRYTSKHGVAHKHYVAFSTPEIHSCFFVFGGTRRHRILLHCTSQCLLCLVSIIFRWLIDAARLVLQSKHQVGKGLY